jgi:hypothetical protein
MYLWKTDRVSVLSQTGMEFFSRIRLVEVYKPYYLWKMKKMISSSEFATKIGKPYPTVMAWLKKDLIQGVEKHEVGKSVIYAIPKDASYTEPVMGRPKKTTTAAETRPAAKKRSGKKAMN